MTEPVVSDDPFVTVWCTSINGQTMPPIPTFVDQPDAPQADEALDVADDGAGAAEQ